MKAYLEIEGTHARTHAPTHTRAHNTLPLPHTPTFTHARAHTSKQTSIIQVITPTSLPSLPWPSLDYKSTCYKHSTYKVNACDSFSCNSTAQTRPLSPSYLILFYKVTLANPRPVLKAHVF